MIGRGSRIWDGKTHFTVLDYGENYKMHGLWDQDRDWHLIWNQAKDKKPGVTPIKFCPVCDQMLKQSEQICPNCGHEFNIVEETEEDTAKDSELMEITKNWAGKKLSELDAKELAIYARLKNKKAWCIRIASSHYQHGKPTFIREFAEAMGYKKSWAHMRMKEIDESKNKIEFYDFVLS